MQAKPITYSSPKKPHLHLNVNIRLMNSVIAPINSCKYLGIYLDDKLTFKDHINYINSKISRHTGILYRIKENLPTRTRLDYYFAFIYPYLSYNATIWGCACPTHLQRLFIQQKKSSENHSKCWLPGSHGSIIQTI